MAQDVMKLFREKEMVKICAPMVRYSKLPFRSLVRQYNCDLCFTPMIVADSFISSEKARNIEFSTSKDDDPLVVQFAANKVDDLTIAAEMVSPYCGGIDVNCGCPQRWAMESDLGAALLKRPDLVRDLVLSVRNKVDQPFSVSIKIRLLRDLQKTIELCRLVEAAGASFVTVHARTPDQRRRPIDRQALKEIRQSLKIPVVANGDVRTLKEAFELQEDTGCKGIMAARGLLKNPALFSGFSATPPECVTDWVNFALQTGANFQCFHHHLVFMLEKVLPKRERLLFNCLRTTEEVLEFLSSRYDLSPKSEHDMSAVLYCNYISPPLPIQCISPLLEDDLLSSVCSLYDNYN